MTLRPATLSRLLTVKRETAVTVGDPAAAALAGSVRERLTRRVPFPLPPSRTCPELSPAPNDVHKVAVADGALSERRRPLSRSFGEACPTSSDSFTRHPQSA